MDENASFNHLIEHLQMVIDAIIEGELVFFLGAGANLCDRPNNTPWKTGKYLPDSSELAYFLSKEFRCRLEDKDELIRVAQYVDTMLGSARLYEKLHQLFDFDYPFTKVHNFLAGLPKTLHEKKYEKTNQLIVTTNYDDLLERAFINAKQEYDLVFYMTESSYHGELMHRLRNGELVKFEEDVDTRGRFVHQLPTGELVLIDKPNEYVYLALEQRPIILKIHGTVDRQNKEKDSYVITEDHYIDYLSKYDIKSSIPVNLNKVLLNSHFLFLGYSLRDWNLRVFLHRLWAEKRLKHISWAIQLDPKDLDREFWLKRNVKIEEIPLGQYINELEKLMHDQPCQGLGEKS